MITKIDIQLAMWTIEPSMAYHWRGAGIFGNGYDAIGDMRSEHAKPSESALISAVLDGVGSYPQSVDWGNLDTSPLVPSEVSIVADGVAETTITLPAAGTYAIGILRDGVPVLGSVITEDLSLSTDAVGRYRVYLINKSDYSAYVAEFEAV